MDGKLNIGNFSPREQRTGGGGKMQTRRSNPRPSRKRSKRPHKIHVTTRDVHDI